MATTTEFLKAARKLQKAKPPTFHLKPKLFGEIVEWLETLILEKEIYMATIADLTAATTTLATNVAALTTYLAANPPADLTAAVASVNSSAAAVAALVPAAPVTDPNAPAAPAAQ